MTRFPFEGKKVVALIRRDARDWSSYRTQVAVTILTALVGFLSWGFNATFRNVAVPEYNTNYVSFLLTGILVGSVILSLTQGLQTRLRPWMIESIIMTGIRPATFVLGTLAWSYVVSIVLFIPQLVIAVLVFNASLNVDLPSLFVAATISSLMIFAISMASTGIRLVTKVTDPISWTLATGQQLLSGMTFPIEHLNNYVPGLTNVSWILPYTWIYHIVRLSSLSGLSILDPAASAAFLVSGIYALVLLPLGILTFQWGLRRAKRDGTLGMF